MFDAQPRLGGELIELRPLEAGDFEALRRAAADPLIWEQHPVRRHEPDVFRAFFDEQLASRGALVVVDRRTGEVIGTSRYHGYDTGDREVEIGWTFLARSHWGGAVNGELKRLMVEHAFRYVDRVVFVVHDANVRSAHRASPTGSMHRDGFAAPTLYLRRTCGERDADPAARGLARDAQGSDRRDARAGGRAAGRRGGRSRARRP